MNTINFANFDNINMDEVIDYMQASSGFTYTEALELWDSAYALICECLDRGMDADWVFEEILNIESSYIPGFAA